MRSTSNALVTLAMLSLLSGCYGQHWPQEFGGGMSEWSPQSSTPFDPSDAGVFLNSRLDVVRQELEVLAANGGNRAVAADMAVMRRTVIAIQRQIAGGLFGEAEKRLFSAELKLSTMKAVTAAFQRADERRGATNPTTL